MTQDRDPFEHGMRSGQEGVRGKVQHTRPCGDCPWRRKAIAGWLGGEYDAEEWRRIAHNDAHVDCHVITNMQCAGIAIYRRNVCKQVFPPLLTLPADKVAVFAWPTEFLEHHTKGKLCPSPSSPAAPPKAKNAVATRTASGARSATTQASPATRARSRSK